MSPQPSAPSGPSATPLAPAMPDAAARPAAPPARLEQPPAPPAKAAGAAPFGGAQRRRSRAAPRRSTRTCDWAVAAFTAATAASLVVGSSGLSWAPPAHPNSLVLDFRMVAARDL